MVKWLFFLVSLSSLTAQAGSIYLCRAYNGGTFWAQAHCNQHSALIEQIVSVPDSLPFDQQVNLAEQQRRGVSGTHTTTNTVTNNFSAPPQNKIGECKALDVQITQFEAMARQPQSGQMQDWITGEKKKARDRQFGLKC